MKQASPGGMPQPVSETSPVAPQRRAAPQPEWSRSEPPWREELGRGKARHPTQSCRASPGRAATPRNGCVFNFVRNNVQVRFAESRGEKGEVVIEPAAGTGRGEEDSV